MLSFVVFNIVPVFEFSIRIRVLLLRVSGMGGLWVVLNYVSDMCECYK